MSGVECKGELGNLDGNWPKDLMRHNSVKPRSRQAHVMDQVTESEESRLFLLVSRKHKLHVRWRQKTC